MTDLLPITWGDRIYLIPNKDLQSFCSWISDGHEPRDDADGLFLLRNEDWKKPTKGAPSLPKEWQRYLPKRLR